ncbi:Retrovirus-related Pol polyprotein from transposon RE1 [Abeliophyllum distichum]|uniref:Retrovirus-related Pol polyprotein from transposon RE1 n=1 Tax=Abeliophyllum distichum TaxID=126358 RepID=A0ABD1TXW9_9LAMI
MDMEAIVDMDEIMGEIMGETITNMVATLRSTKQKKTTHPKRKYEENCHNYGMKGHLPRTYHTTKNLVDLYHKLIKKKDNVVTNFANFDDRVDVTHLDVSDFFAGPSGNIDNLIRGVC